MTYEELKYIKNVQITAAYDRAYRQALAGSINYNGWIPWSPWVEFEKKMERGDIELFSVDNRQAISDDDFMRILMI